MYFSATGTTKGVAERIAGVTNADIFELIPAEPYSDADLDWNDSGSRTTIEMNDPDVRPAISLQMCCLLNIFDFLSTEDEYTERMALESLAFIDPEQAEKYAIVFWNRGKYPKGSYEDEYQKIMALHVLYKVNSASLDKHLDIAEKSDYHYLKMNAQEIHEKIRLNYSL